MEDEDRDKPWNFHTCRLCPYRSRSIFRMCNHVRWHSIKLQMGIFKCELDVPEMFECEHCVFETDIKVKLQHHLNVNHGGKVENLQLKNILKHYKCEDCDLQTHALLVATKHSYDFDHVGAQNAKRKHSQKRKIEKNGTVDVIDWHTNKQGIISWFKCKQCTFKHKYKIALNQHKISHRHVDDTQWFECDLCTFKCKDKRKLNIHVYKRHTRNVEWKQCDHCQYKTKYKASMRKHNRLHANAEDVKWFKCGHCSFKTIHVEVMRRHIVNKHTRAECKNWYECDQCTYRSTDSRNLRRHINCKHAGPEDVILFECAQCDFKSKLKEGLKRHIQRWHMNKKM